ncbi:helix-turn-helix transcriptional regulator [Ottowia thiooxydans]|uniref:Transcriptional regulator YheO n=1 Tax=Ottowia thiooxydans TaxID=219182 RepID=A0ABV2QGF1_9BURK
MDPTRAHILAAIKVTLPAWQSMVGPHVEIVLHDLCKPENSVIYIANGHVTGRSTGASLLGGPLNDKAFLAARRELSQPGGNQHSVILDYPTLAPDGRPLKSATVVFRDQDGVPFLALCLNSDLQLVKDAMRWLEGFLTPAGASEPPRQEPHSPAVEVPAAPKEQDLEVLMRTIVEEAVARLGKPVREMSRDEKLEALKPMVSRGVLLVRGGVGRVAQALGVTRFTIYNYLDILREREGITSAK